MRPLLWLVLLLLCAACQNPAPPAQPPPEAASAQTELQQSGVRALQGSRLLLEDQSFGQAETWAREAWALLEGSPDRWQALVALGDAQFMQDAPEEALQSYLDALDQGSPGKAPVRFANTWLLASMIHVQLSLGIMDQWGEPDPENFTRHSEAAIALARRGIEQIAQQLGTGGADSSAWAAELAAIRGELFEVELQCLLELPERAGEAESALRAAIARQPGQPALLRELGDRLQRQGDVAGARASYREALAADPGSRELHQALGTLAYQDAALLQAELADTGDSAQAARLEQQLTTRFREALQHFEAVCAQQPDVLTLTTLRGLALSLEDAEAYARYGQALQELEDQQQP